jgi:hypothetical protein
MTNDGVTFSLIDVYLVGILVAIGAAAGVVLAACLVELAHGETLSEDRVPPASAVVTISLKEYCDLEISSIELHALHNAGVDNWVGYNSAIDPKTLEIIRRLRILGENPNGSEADFEKIRCDPGDQ